MVKVDYDPEFDILYISKGEKVVFSINLLDNFILDVNHAHKIVGLEILNASKVLKMSKEELENVKKTDVSTLSHGEYYSVHYYVVSPKSRVESEVAVMHRREAITSL